MDKYTKPDFSSVALITIDTQRDTLDGQPFEIPGTSAVLPQMQRLIRAFRLLKLPIIHIVRLYKQDGSNVDLCRRSFIEGGKVLLQPGSLGCELALELLPEPEIRLNTDLLLSGGIQYLSSNEVILYKPRWGAFFKTSLEDYLRKLRISTLAFTGCNFPNCPRTSIYEASERDFKIILVEDAISGLYDRGKDEMRNICVLLMSTKELEEAVFLKKEGPTSANTV